MKKKYEAWTGRPFNKDYCADVVRTFIPALMYVLVYLSWFFYIENHNFGHYTVIHTKVDDAIPFLEIFIVPYYLWFFYVGVVMITLVLSYEITDFNKSFIFLATGMTIFLIISTLWPNVQHLRPTVMPRDNIFTQMCLAIYKTDTPTNLWPSIHVYNSIGIMIAIHRSKRFGKAATVAGDLLGISIIFSTMFVKQHSFYDVVTACIMALVFYLLYYHTSFLENFCKRKEQRLALYN